MNERILQIIDITGLSAIQFADKVGLNRSIIYHIKNGRSAPSLDVVLKILNVYPQINTDWLLHGKGEMMNQALDQFEDNDLYMIDDEEESINSIFEEKEEMTNSTDVNNENESKNTPLNYSEADNKSLSRVPIKMILFYSDSSFEVFSMEKGKLV